MANALYPLGKKAIFDGDVHLDSDTIKVALIDTGTISYNAAHDFYNDISTGVVGTPVALASKTTTAGVFDSADPTLTGVSGSTVEAIVLYVDSGDPATSQLIAWYDTGITGIPFTPNGGDVTITVNASGWFGI